MNNAYIERVFLTDSISIDHFIMTYIDGVIDTLLSEDYDNIQVNTVSSQEKGGTPL